MLDTRSLGGSLATLAWVALRNFVGTVFVVSLAGVVLAVVSYTVVREHNWLYGVIGAVVAILEAVGAGVALGGKRAGVMALVYGLSTLRLGRSLIQAVFDRLTGVAEGTLVRGVERIPLRQAEELLTGAITGMVGESEQGGWVRQKLRARLLNAVGTYTLARFREKESEHGGIDLLKVRTELEQTVDDTLIRKVQSGLRLWTLGVIIGLPVVVAFQTWLIVALMHAKGR